jgi:hypothetical protein
MATVDYGLQSPTAGLGLRTTAPLPAYQDSFATWNPASYQAPVTPGGYGGLDFNWNTSTMGGDGFQAGNMGGYGLNAMGATIATPNLTGGITPPGGTNSIWDSFFTKRAADGTQTQGWGGLALGGAQALGSLYMGMKQYNLAKDSLAFQKESFNKQYENQKTLTNSQLEDRQRARVASNAGAYQSVGDYMNQNGVK